MKYNITRKVQNKYAYTVKGDYRIFMNRLIYFIISRKNKNINIGSDQFKKSNEIQNSLNDFLTYCELHTVDPENFILSPSKYKLITNKDELKTVEFDINKFGLHWKHKVMEYINLLDYDDIYNFIFRDNTISYSFIESDFLEKMYPKVIETYFTNTLDLCLGRGTEYRLKDYLNLNFYDFEIKLEEVKRNEYTGYFIIHTNNGMSNAIYQDYCFFYERNTVECPKCNKLVKNSFDEYMIQFYKHDGC